MKYTLPMRWLSVFSCVLIVSAGLLGVVLHASELNFDVLSLIDLSILEEELALTALDLLMIVLLVCFLIRLVTELLGRRAQLIPQRLWVLKSRELLFDHGSRAPPCHI